MQPAAPTNKFALGDRNYLQEKVVTIYDTLWRGGNIDFAELFDLKVNATWLQEHVATSTAQDLSVRKPTIRRLFGECCVRLTEEQSADVQSHAMETLSSLLLGLGCRTFHDPVSEVLDLLCGLEAADEVFGKLLAHIKRVVSSPRRGATSVALRRVAVRLLLAIAASAADLNANILVDLLMPKGFEAPVAALLTQGVDAEAPRVTGSTSAAATAAAWRSSLVEDVALVLVLLAAYRRHESPNAFLRMISDAGSEAPHLQSLAQVSRKVFERCMYPSEASANATYLSPSWSYSLARAAEWAAHMLTVESYLPSSITRQLSSPQALRENAAPLTVALLITYELATPRGGATLAALCAQPEATPQGALGGGGGGSSRGALLRHLFSVASLLACDARDALLVAQLRFALLLIERLLDGSSSAALLLSVDLGGGLPMWSYSSVHITESALPSPQPLLAGAYTLLASLLTQNLRRATFHPPLYLQALTLLHRLLVAQQRAAQSLPLLKWEQLWSALFTVADFIAQDDVFAIRGAPEVGLRALELVNVFVTLGDTLLPTGAHFESFAYELVRRHRTFEKVYRVARRAAPRVVEALALTRSLIVSALEAIGKMDATAASKLTSQQALDVIRALDPHVSSEQKAALLKPPSQLAPHEQLALSQSLLRVLLAHCRQDGSLAPLHFEDLVSS